MKRLIISFLIMGIGAACVSSGFDPKHYLAHPYCCLWISAGIPDSADAGPQ